MSVFIPPGKQQFFNPATGAPLAFGKVYHYIPSTSTPKDTWADEGLTSLNTNPITLDANGVCIIWGNGLYRQRLLDAALNEIWDQVTGFRGSGPVLSVDGISPDSNGNVDVPSNSAFYPQLTEFGGVPDGVPGNPTAGTDNIAAFTAAVADPSSRIWLTDGFFRTSQLTGSLYKYFDGPGRIYDSTSAEVLPGRFTYLLTPPSQYPIQGVGGWFAGDTSYITPEWFIIGGACRHSISERYFEATTIPHNRWFTSFGGSSGCVAHVASGAIVGAVGCTLNSVEGLAVGDVVGFSALFGGGITDQVTLSAVTPGPNTIAFAPPLANAYATGDIVLLALRTNNPFTYTFGRNSAAGDFYGDVQRLQQLYEPLAGQTHFFETSTVGQYGGDIYFFFDGTYATGWESIYSDNGNDVAVIAQVDSFIRDNDTGARAVVWLGTYFQSTGATPADCAHAVAGKWRIGLDTTRADLTTFVTASDNINAAINTKMGDRWVMNSTVSTSARGGDPVYGAFFGNVPGDMFVESGTDGTSDYIALRFNRAGPNDGRLRVRPTQITVNKTFLGAQSIEAALELVTNSGSTTGVPTVVWGSGLGVWIEWDGTNLRATKNNGGAFTNIV